MKITIFDHKGRPVDRDATDEEIMNINAVREQADENVGIINGGSAQYVLAIHRTEGDGDAKQNSEAGKDDEGGSAQPGVREEGGDTEEGSEGVRESGSSEGEA